MKANRVLIVSSHPLFAEGLARLVREAGGEVAAKVADLHQALLWLQEDSPVTVIVDHEEARPHTAEWPLLLQRGHAACRIILLTLAGNEMIVHERRRVTHATADELIRVLRAEL